MNMVTSIVLIALIGTLHFNSAISAALNYEPIKITVNENFNAQPGQVSPELQEPGVLHQGANFYFKPQLNLPPSYIPSHIEALISLIQQHHHPCAKDNSKVVVEKNKRKEILRPFMYPLSDISKETLSAIVLENENNSEIVKPIIITEEPKPVTPKLLVIPEAPILPPSSFNGGILSLVEKEMKKEESVILEEPTDVFPAIPELPVRAITGPIINYVEPKRTTSGPVVIPQAPVLTPLSTNNKHVVEEEVKSVEPIVVDVEPKPAIQELVQIPEAPVLPSFSVHDFSSIIEEEEKKEKSIILEKPTGVLPTISEIAERPIEEPIINFVEPKPTIQELVSIPEAPVLPTFSLDDISSIIEEELKKEESFILAEPTVVLPTIPEIAERRIEEPIIHYVEPKPITSGLAVIPKAPMLPPLFTNNIHVVEEGMKSVEPIVVDVEPVSITEAPVLPSFSLHDISSIIEEELKKEESIILEKPTGVFPTIPEIAEKLIEEPIINFVEPKPTVQELVSIPEAPVSPSFSVDDISSNIKEELKKEESIILEKPTGVFPTIPEIAERPMEEPIVNFVEPKPTIQELVPIPEAPVLPTFSLDDISSNIEEELKKEESIILEKPTGVFPTIPEIAERSIEEPIIKFVEPKPITSKLLVIPEAPVLPPLTLNEFHSVVEEMKKEESIILEETTGVFPTIPEIAERPMEEPIVNFVEPKPTIQELVSIPEAPVLPTFSLDDISSNIEEKLKKEESIILEKPTGVFPTIQEIAERPIEEPIVNFVEPKPTIQELVPIPEAPVLPTFSLDDISSNIEEELKKEESIILEKPTGVFPTIPEIAERPMEEPIVKFVEPKPITSKLLVIPEAPVLPPLTLNEFHSVVEEMKKEESVILEETTGVFPTISEIAERPMEDPIVNFVEPKPTIQELVSIPEAPVLPTFSLDDISSNIEEKLKKEESIILEKPTGVFPTIPEIAERPIEEPIVNFVEPKPTIQELLSIPEAPVLPTFSLDDISSIIEEELKKEESFILAEPTVVLPTIPEIAERRIEEPIIHYVEPKPITSGLAVIPKAPMLPPLFTNNIHVVEEGMKSVEPIVVDVEPVSITEAPVLPSFSLHDISSNIEEKLKKEESIILEKPTGVFPTIPEIAEGPMEEPIVNFVEPKPTIQELVPIPAAPVLPTFLLDDISSNIKEELKKEESIILEKPTGVFPTIPEIAERPMEEPIVNFVEPKPTIQELVPIPEAPVLPTFSLDDISSNIEEELKKEESIILEKPTGVFPTIPEIAERSIEEPIIKFVEPKPITSKLLVIPEAPVLPPLTLNEFHSVVEEMKKEESIKVEESTGVFLLIPEISAKPFPQSLENIKLPETPESFALENNIFPVVTEEVKIQIPILLEESIEVLPPIAEISSGPTLQESSPEITDSYVLEEVSQSNSENVVTIKETLPPTIIQKPSNNLGVFSYVPFVSHLSYNHAPKTKNLMIPKPASLERFLLKKHLFRLPVTPFPKLDLNAVKCSIWGNKKQFLYPTSYAHDVVAKRIAPNMAFEKQNAPKRVKIYIRSNVPKGPSYL